jgi:hypothetical protein
MSDPSADIVQISGFYGPGAWAAWFITLMASWLPIRRDDYSHNLHYISYALYMNWAAIDLLRQTKALRKIRSGAAEDSKDPVVIARDKAISASFAVLGIGVFHAYLQCLVCLRRYRKEGNVNSTDAKSGRRMFVILLFVTLPATVWICYSLTFVFASELALSMRFSMLLTLSVLVGVVIAPLALAIQTSDSLFFSSVSFGFLYILLFYTVASTAHVVSWGCYIIPCAPQSTSEWDQAFSLFFALFIFVYELGPRGVKVFLTEIWLGVRFCWKKIPGSVKFCSNKIWLGARFCWKKVNPESRF